MSLIRCLAVSGSLLLAAPYARAGDCDGDAGWDLEMPDRAAIGSKVSINVHGPANEMGFFMVSLGEGPVDSVYGTICLDFPLLLSFLFQIGSDGNYRLDAEVPCDPAAVDLTLFAQFITCKPNRGISNQDSIVIVDGLCPGDLFTFDQLDYGGECEEDNPACRLEEAFDQLFPKGLKIGDQGGKENEFHALEFESAAAIEGFLPANDGPPEILDEDQTDPTESNAGDFAGQLAAARLNVALDDAGFFDDLKARPDVKLGDLVFVANVNPDFFGLTGREFVDICDLAISGQLDDEDGDGDYDIDFDGDEDATLKDLTDALKALSNNFEDGTINRGTMALP